MEARVNDNAKKILLYAGAVAGVVLGVVAALALPAAGSAMRAFSEACSVYPLI